MRLERCPVCLRGSHGEHCDRSSWLMVAAALALGALFVALMGLTR